MQPNQGIKTWQWVVTVIVIAILIILGYYIIKGNSAKAPSTTVTEESVIDNNTQNNINRIVVSDQYPGNVVYVSSVQLASPGWVEIHKDNNGVPGAIIGSVYFDKGTYPGKINLTEKTVDGKLYYAMLHNDDGDKKFDSSKDLPLKDAQGNIIMKTFRATSNVTEIKG